MNELKILDEMENDIEYLFSNCMYDIKNYFEPIENKYSEKYEKINYMDKFDKIKRAKFEELQQDVMDEIMKIKKIINKNDLDLFLFWFIFIMTIELNDLNGWAKMKYRCSNLIKEYTIFKEKYSLYLNTMTSNILYDISNSYDAIKRFVFNSYYQNRCFVDFLYDKYMKCCRLDDNIIYDILEGVFMNMLDDFSELLIQYKQQIKELRLSYTLKIIDINQCIL